MKLSHLYDQAIKSGREHDPRGKGNYDYADSRLLYGDPSTQVSKVLAGIDIEVGELLLADKLRRDSGLDAVIAHHPEGAAQASFYEVMLLQIDTLSKAGIPRDVAKQLLEERKWEVERKVMPANHMRTVDAARLLDMPLMCLHTPADNQVWSFIEALIKKEKPKFVGDIVDILLAVPEYKKAKKDLAGPKIIYGNPKRKVGKVLVDMTGGTEGHREVYDKLHKAGIRTIIGMHLSEDHLKKVKDVNLNVVIAGHISSDTLGLNLLLDQVEKEEPLEIIGCSGFQRIRRRA